METFAAWFDRVVRPVMEEVKSWRVMPPEGWVYIEDPSEELGDWYPPEGDTAFREDTTFRGDERGVVYTIHVTYLSQAIRVFVDINLALRLFGGTSDYDERWHEINASIFDAPWPIYMFHRPTGLTGHSTYYFEWEYLDAVLDAAAQSEIIRTHFEKQVNDDKLPTETRISAVSLLEVLYHRSAT